MTMEQAVGSVESIDGGWVDEVLLAGPADQVCFRTPEPIDRATLRRLVADRRDRLAAGGLRPRGAAALRLPPSIAYVENLLAVWQLGGQAILLDHRLTDYEVDQAVLRLAPQVMLAPLRISGGLRVFYDVADEVRHCGDQPAGTEHAVVQLSSGSTGPSKVVMPRR